MSDQLPSRNEFAVMRGITPRWNDNDQYGHINNAVYYEYFDSAINAWLTESCGSPREFDALGVVAETSCRFLSSASFPDHLEVGISLKRLGKSSITYRVAVFPLRGEAPHVLGTFVHVYVDPVSRRPTAVPAGVAALVRSSFEPVTK